jgi:chromosome condensin MukBEF complex kleisin-like MukF subunit
MLKKKPFEIIVKLRKQRLENLNDKNNRVIKLFIKLYKNIKIPLELNKNNKEILKNNNQASKFNANKFI